MDYIHQGFIDEDDYLDYVDSLERNHKRDLKEPPAKFWVEDDPETRKIIEDCLLNVTIEVEKLEQQKDDLVEFLNEIPDDPRPGIYSYWKDLLLDLTINRKIEDLKALVKYSRLALYIPREENDPNTITPDQIEMAKSIPIENFIGQSPRMSGQKMFFCCPFHEEKTGSFCVFLKDNTYHCFGCGKSGDSISFVREFEKLEFADAVRFLIGQHK